MVLVARFDLIEYDFDHDMLVSVTTGFDAHLDGVRQYANDDDADTWDAFHDIDSTVGRFHRSSNLLDVGFACFAHETSGGYFARAQACG